nr:hypothetical protein [Tanacetum cinerariifolium]
LTDVNVNKLYQPWRSFASVINKCLTGKSSDVDSFRLSQAQMLWGFYHIINIDFAYLIWEDFVYQVVSRHQTTQQYGEILPIELTTEEIRNNKAYKEYYACAMEEATPKPKVSARKKNGESASSTTPPTPTPTTTVESSLRLSATAKGKQPSRATTPIEPTDVQRTEAEQLKIVLKRSRQETQISQQRSFGTDKGTGSKPGVPDVPSDDSEEELSWNSSDDEEVGKSSGVDSFRLSQAQMLWGFYHRVNIDFAYLIWEDFVYQVEHKNQKRSNEMNYPRFTKVLIDRLMTRKPSISRRNRINWHYVRDDALFFTIKVVSRHQIIQQYGAILPSELTTDEIRNSKAYKEYYACAMGEAAPKPKASARKKKGESASSTTPPTPTPTTTIVSAPRLSATAKGKKSDESDDDHDEGSDNDSDETVKSVAGKDDDDDDDKDDDDNDEEEELAKDDEEDKETGKGGDKVRESEGESEEEEPRQEDDENFDLIPRTPDESEEESNDEEDQELRHSEEERIQEEEEANKLYFDVDINQGRGLQVTQNVEDTHVILTPLNPDDPQSEKSEKSNSVRL